MTDFRILISRTLYLCVGVTVLVVVCYAGFFWYHDIGISEDSATWGTFGDYFGGILNPIFSLANLVLLIIISYQLAARDDKRNRLPLQHSAIKELDAIFEDVPRPLLWSNEYCSNFFKFYHRLHSECVRAAVLFPNSGEQFSEFNDVCLQMCTLCQHWIQTWVNRTEEDVVKREELKGEICEYHMNSLCPGYREFISRLRDSIRDK